MATEQAHLPAGGPVAECCSLGQAPKDLVRAFGGCGAAAQQARQPSFYKPKLTSRQLLEFWGPVITPPATFLKKTTAMSTAAQMIANEQSSLRELNQQLKGWQPAVEEAEVSATLGQYLLPVVSQLALIAERLEQISERLNEPPVYSSWIGAEDAANLLGIKITSGGYHRRKLGQYREAGLLAKFKLGRPIMYDRIEVEELARKIRDGKVNYL